MADLLNASSLAINQGDCLTMKEMVQYQRLQDEMLHHLTFKEIAQFY